MWGAKLFHSQTAEEACALARAHFGCAEPQVRAMQLQEATVLEPGLFLTLYGDTPEEPAAADNMNAFIAVVYRDDGVWVEKYPSRGRGDPLDRKAAETYIRRKAIQGLEIAPLALLLDRPYGLVRVAGPQPAVLLNQELDVAISADEQEAFATLMPADPGGAGLDDAGAAEQLRRAGVVAGLDAEGIRRLLMEGRLDRPYPVARGRKPVDGVGGRMQIHFRTTLTAAPKIVDERSGRVDYRALDLFEPVQAGQLLASRTIATPGEPGITVTGKELPARPGRDAVLPRGRGVRYDDLKVNMYAETSGMVQYAKGVISVSHVYSIRGNCDMSVGNIDFDGNVEIGGTIISGMTVRATGNIVVGGVVEGATIDAGGDIVLRSGIQGMDRGRLISGGDITAQFIERCAVTAWGNVTADVILHSQLAVAGGLRVQGRRGSLVGGTTKVAREIVATSLGSSAQASTQIEVGALPATRERIEFLRLEQRRLLIEQEKLETLASYLEKTGQLDAARTKLYNSIEESRFQNTQFLQEYAEEMQRLIDEVQNAIDGKVHVLGTAFEGVRLAISSAWYKVERDIPFATFYYRDGEIAYMPCMMSNR